MADGFTWSEKIKALVVQLEKQGIMTDHGRAKIEEAKQNGQWNIERPIAITQEQVAALAAILSEFEVAYANFMAVSFSVQKTYTRGYLDAKTAAGRIKRLAWMVDRLNRNLKPM